jgi:hypothetical protein
MAAVNGASGVTVFTLVLRQMSNDGSQYDGRLGLSLGCAKLSFLGSGWARWFWLLLFHLGFLFRRNDMAGSAFRSQFSSPASKLIRCFMKGRDGWKGKHRALKVNYKKLAKKSRDLEKSRENWRERTRQAEQRAVELEQQVNDLKCRRQFSQMPCLVADG